MARKPTQCRWNSRGAVAAAAIVMMAMTVQGCGRRSGVTRYGIQGEITFLGKHVPAGKILFEPDASRGGSGPGAMADINAGRYSIPSRRGVVTGPHRVRIFPYAPGDSAADTSEMGPPMKMLRPEHVEQVDIDPKKSVLNFDLPEPARKGKGR